MKVIIMRGLPGSGKSTWCTKGWNVTGANSWRAGAIAYCSADHFHTGADGVYRFRKEQAGEAHRLCLEQFLGFVTPVTPAYSPPDYVVVDNTNTTAAEVAPYYRVAEVYRHQVEVVRIHVPFEVAYQRNTHQVPDATMWAMWQHLQEERLPPYWRERIILGG